MKMVFKELGFESLADMVKSTLALKTFHCYILGISLSGLLAGVETITSHYVYTPALGIYILWVTTIFDAILGVSVAIHLKTGIIPNRIIRAFTRIIVQTLIVALLFQMSKAWPVFIATWMVDSLLIVFTLSTFYSVIQNANKLELISKDQYSFIEGLVNIKNILGKLKKKNENQS